MQRENAVLCGFPSSAKLSSGRTIPPSPPGFGIIQSTFDQGMEQNESYKKYT